MSDFGIDEKMAIYTLNNNSPLNNRCRKHSCHVKMELGMAFLPHAIIKLGKCGHRSQTSGYFVVVGPKADAESSWTCKGLPKIYLSRRK